MTNRDWQWIAAATWAAVIAVAAYGGNALAVMACVIGGLTSWTLVIVEGLLDALEREHDALVAAALRLYWSGYWECKQLPDVEQAQIWIELRDALGLPAGTSPARSVGRA